MIEEISLGGNTRSLAEMEAKSWEEMPPKRPKRGTKDGGARRHGR